MKKKIFLLIVVAFVFLNLFAVSAEDNETVIDDSLGIDETASPVVSIGTYVSDEMINVADSPNVGAIDPSLEPPKFVVKSFNTTDLVKIYKNDSQFVVDARNTLCNSIHFFIYHDNLNKMENIISFGDCKVNESGYATVNIDLNPGVYYIDVEQFVSTDNQLYLYNYASTNKITVLSTLIGENLVKYYRNGSQFDIKLVDSSNKSVASQNVTFKVNGVSYSRQTNEEGIARLNINLRPGEYVLTATDPSTGLNMPYNITVLPTLIGDNLIKYHMNASQFDIKLLDSKGAPAASQNVKFNINGIFYSRQTNEEGIARLNINLGPGEYVLTATDPSTGLNMSYNITVLPVLYADDVVSNGSSCNYWVKLVDGKGNILPGQLITFNVGGMILNNVSDGNGEAKICLNLMPGQYIVTAQYLAAKISNNIILHADKNNIDNNTDTEQESTNQKYYVLDTYGNPYYFYENGTTGEIDIWGHENDHKTPILNKDQINYYIENEDFSYALAYLKYNHEHGGNLTYDEVYNSAAQGDAGETKNWIFYNNGTVTRNITMHYNNGTSKIIPYSTTYKTSINGVAQWFDIIDMYEDGNDSGLPYANNLQRYNDGVFNDIFEIKIDDYNIETLVDDKNTTINQT